MRFAAACLAVLALAACNQEPAAPPPAEEEQVFMRVPPPWFICDSINSGAVIVFDRNASDVRVAEYQKSDGAIVQRIGYFVGDEDAAAGSMNTELIRDQGSDGWVRMTNAGMLETPATAYTPRFVSALLDGRDLQCRWLPRTRVLGFTTRRSFAIHEDASGALTYTAYNFSDASSSRAVDGAENARTTASSLEITGGVAGETPEGAKTYTFETQGFRYVVTLNRDGTGSIDVTRNGAPLTNEPLIGYQQGTPPAPAATTP